VEERNALLLAEKAAHAGDAAEALQDLEVPHGDNA
jgi:hypothetical protein